MRILLAKTLRPCVLTPSPKQVLTPNVKWQTPLTMTFSYMCEIGNCSLRSRLGILREFRAGQHATATGWDGAQELRGIWRQRSMPNAARIAMVHIRLFVAAS